MTTTTTRKTHATATAAPPRMIGRYVSFLALALRRAEGRGDRGADRVWRRAPDRDGLSLSTDPPRRLRRSGTCAAPSSGIGCVRALGGGVGGDSLVLATDGAADWGPRRNSVRAAANCAIVA